MQTLFNRLRRAIAAFGVVILASTRLLAAEPPLPGTAVTATKAKNVCFADTLAVTGVLMPRAEVLVRPDQEGLLISQVSADVGDSVKAGQTLAQLVRPDTQPGATSATIPVPAPVSGVILRRAAVVGTMASARAEPLFSIIAQGDLEVSAEVSAKNLARVSPGQVAKVKIIGVGELPGWIRFVSTTVDPTTQQGEAPVRRGQSGAAHGTFARAIVTLGQSCGIAIPLSGVLYGKEGPVVQVVRGERVQTRAITTGPTFDGKVQVTKGLAEGDVVVMRAGAFLRDGDPVRPVLADDTSAGK
ncbi:MAG: HlyD family efflux transporter periplasmic adaptor subunit [Xanthobacteraceae bacterium]